MDRDAGFEVEYAAEDRLGFDAVFRFRWWSRDAAAVPVDAIDAAAEAEAEEEDAAACACA